jgi:hypothetical protein
MNVGEAKAAPDRWRSFAVVNTTDGRKDARAAATTLN